jgi:integrase
VWARSYYQQQRSKGQDHHAAVRALAFKWIRVVFRCWKDGVESKYLASTKTEASKGLVPVVPHLRSLLDMWKASLKPNQLASDAPMFAASNGKPLRLHNVELRTIMPALQAAQIGWNGWHAFRRGLATRLHDLGVPDITIQAILRHSSVSVTRACYIKTLAKQVVGAMNTFAGSLPELCTTCAPDSADQEEPVIQ